MPHQRGFLRRHYSGPVCIQRDRVLRAPRYIYRQLQADSARGVHSRGKGGALYDETNRRPRTTTMPDDHDHGDATRFHFFTSSSSFVRANPFIWNMPDWSLHRIRHLSKASASHSIPRVLGLQPSPVSHVSQYRTKTLSRTYLYDLVCDVTRFTHLVTSHSADNVVRMTRGLANPRSGELWVWGIRHTHNPNPA